MEQVDTEQQTAQQSQSTDRHHNAVDGLGHSSRNVRLSNILALQHLGVMASHVGLAT
ncbi:hypothetical protein [Streptomyces sp. NPDC055134]